MKWEYATFKIETTGLMGGKLDESQLASKMNELGNDGWELVTSVATNQGYGSTRDVVIIFKRPKNS